MTRLYGFKPSFNQSYTVDDSPTGWWVPPCHFGIDQGPVVLMIENIRTGLLWNIMRRCPPLVAGLHEPVSLGGGYKPIAMKKTRLLVVAVHSMRHENRQLQIA